MQMVESRLRMKKKSQKMTVEKYVDFIDSKKQFDLTIPNLNEVSLLLSESANYTCRYLSTVICLVWFQIVIHG